MQALKERPARTESQAAPSADLRQVAEHIAALLLEAASCVAPTRVSDIVRGWLGRLDLSSVPPAQEAALMAEALAMALITAVFTPTGSGTTAVDRLARRSTPATPAIATALAALGRTQFSVLQVEGVESEGRARLRDMASGKTILVDDDAMHPAFSGLHVAAWLAPLPDGRNVFVGGVTPLDEAGLTVAMSFARPGRPGLMTPVRCADAVYRHVLRCGTPRVPGLNEPLPGQDEEPAEDDELDRLALQWAEPGHQRDPDDVQFVRAETSLECVVAMLASAVNTREHGLAALSDAYASIAQIQLETLQRRAAAGSGTLRVETVAAAVAAGIAAGDLSPATHDILTAVRWRLGAGNGGSPGNGNGASVELDKLIGRIQALRAKTVEQGCTEQEALAAATKVAELLDRYGLSLSELDLRGQACEGSALETERKRAGPIDDCVPAVAAFFDCRVWGEKGNVGRLRYVFFGLPADVAAARYLYDLVDQAFTRETASFKAGETYAELPSAVRRTATNSFQTGLGRGIIAKLHAIRATREVELRRSSGRDLVVLKADIVEAEMAALGLSLRARGRSGGRRLLKDAFDQGHAAGLDFEYTQGIGVGGC